MWFSTMYPGKAVDNNSSASKMARFQGCMLSTASLTIVLVSNYNPWLSLSLQEREGREKERERERKSGGGGGGEEKKVLVFFLPKSLSNSSRSKHYISVA